MWHLGVWGLRSIVSQHVDGPILVYVASSCLTHCFLSLLCLDYSVCVGGQVSHRLLMLVHHYIWTRSQCPHHCLTCGLYTMLPRCHVLSDALSRWQREYARRDVWTVRGFVVCASCLLSRRVPLVCHVASWSVGTTVHRQPTLGWYYSRLPRMLLSRGARHLPIAQSLPGR
jgi:hypothetical protein